jgi:hypothetical protein
MSDKKSAGKLRNAITRIIRAGLDDRAIGAQCHMLGSDLSMELGVCPIREEELIGVVRDLLAKTPARATTGVPEIDRLADDRARAILAEVFRFMYRREDETWDRDKDIPGAELVSLLCSEMPEVGRREEGPDPAGGLVSRLEEAAAREIKKVIRQSTRHKKRSVKR